MKKYLRFSRIVMIVLLACIACSCSWKREPDWRLKELRPDWIYEEEAIKLHIKADPDLNLYDGEPHTLFVCVYQLRNPNAINQYAGSNEMIYELFGENCSFSDSSVTDRRALTIRPGNDLFFTLDRGEGTRYIAIIAGYSALEKNNVLRILEVPVLAKSKMFSKISKPGVMNIELVLGPEKIIKIKEE